MVELCGLSAKSWAGMTYTTDEATWCAICRLFEAATGMSLDGVFLLNEAVDGLSGVSLSGEVEELLAAVEHGVPDDAMGKLLAECGTDLPTLRGEARRFLAFSRASGGWVMRTPARLA